MQITLKERLIEAITLPKLKPFNITEDSLRWNHELIIDLKKLNLIEVKKLQKLLEQFINIFGTKSILKDIETWLLICENQTPKITKFENFKDALIEYLLPFERHWLYKKSDEIETQWIAYRVTNIEYHPKQVSRDYNYPAHIDVDFIFEKFGLQMQKSITFHAEDVLRKSVPEILALEGYYAETKELRNSYLNNLKRYSEIIPLIGKQFILKGIAHNETPDDFESSNSRKIKEKIIDVVENKVVIDIFHEDVDNSDDYNRSYSGGHHELGGYFWEAQEDSVSERKGKEPEERTEDPVIELPVHPFVIIFDLQRHLRMSTHVTTLTEYVYDKKLSEKLILPTNIKELINILIEHKAGGFKDIIRGKSGGAIILLTGLAGVGKTLTAEVFAESTERALYSVQASQLGINPIALEDELKKILKRASRWNAILLIDEADVYVHERGNDLIQNAIVGVFLRVLEYHTSMLFMTTNRPDIVDDAIASRCVARIDYNYPNKEQQKMIWRVLADSSTIKLTDDSINAFVENHNDFSGRDIKNILKLANLKSVAENKPIDITHIDYVSQFNPTLVKKESKQS